jgi:peroxiredoxin
MSYDRPDENRAWVELMGFEFPLLSDPTHEVARMMGAERGPDERGAGFPRRITYLVDPDLVVREVYRVGRDETAGHAEAVLADLLRHASTG